MPETLRRLLFVVFLAFVSVLARAGDAGVTYAKIGLSEEGYVLDADFSFDLNQKLIDALAHGVALHFVAELRIEHPRWYWFNRLIVQRRLEYRLAYHAMTRSYRLNIGSLHRNFDSLAEALHSMERIRSLYVAPSDAFNAKDRYEVTLRFFHDTSQLPKPFQLSALANGKWDLGTGWRKWHFTPEMPTSEKAIAMPTDEESAAEELAGETTTEEAMPEVVE